MQVFTCIPAVLDTAMFVQLLKKLKVPDNASIVLYPAAVLVAARQVQLLKNLQVLGNVSIDSARYLNPWCASCSQAGPTIEDTEGSRQCEY